MSNRELRRAATNNLHELLSLNSAKGADGCHQQGAELPRSSDGTPNTAPVLREFLNTFVSDAADADLQSLSKEELFRRIEEVTSVGRLILTADSFQPVESVETIKRLYLTAFPGDASDFFAARDK
jgi:hypothetical protein